MEANKSAPFCRRLRDPGGGRAALDIHVSELGGWSFCRLEVFRQSPVTFGLCWTTEAPARQIQDFLTPCKQV